MVSQTATVYQKLGTSTRRLGPVQSPVVSAAITRRVNEVRASSALKRATASICIALLLIIDWYIQNNYSLINAHLTCGSCHGGVAPINCCIWFPEFCSQSFVPPLLMLGWFPHEFCFPSTYARFLCLSALMLTGVTLILLQFAGKLNYCHLHPSIQCNTFLHLQKQ